MECIKIDKNMYICYTRYINGKGDVVYAKKS